MECGLIHIEDVEGMRILFLVRWLLRHDLIHEVRHQIRREGIILSYVVAIFGNTPSPMSKAMLAIDDDLLQVALDRVECVYGIMIEFGYRSETAFTGVEKNSLTVFARRKEICVGPF